MNTVLIKENETFDFKPFSIAIKQARLKAGLTIEQLAESTGVTAISFCNRKRRETYKH